MIIFIVKLFSLHQIFKVSLKTSVGEDIWSSHTEITQISVHGNGLQPCVIICISHFPLMSE